jgi:leucyl/phenylalanyl-tRNA--protein transferase
VTRAADPIFLSFSGGEPFLTMGKAYHGRDRTSPRSTLDGAAPQTPDAAKVDEAASGLTACADSSTIANMKTAPRKFELTADILLRAYSIGVFPMAESRDAKDLFWVEPQERGIFPLDGLIVTRSLAKTVRSDRFRVVADRAFETIVRACAEREKTWINDEIVRLYGELFAAGHAHSLEAYEGETLVGGLYGVSLRGAFFGESMFHRVRDASKVALVHLFARLRTGGFRLLDAQFSTQHLASLGAIEIPRDAFRFRLAEALDIQASFCAWPAETAMSGAEALRRVRGDGTEVATGDSPRRSVVRA